MPHEPNVALRALLGPVGYAGSPGRMGTRGLMNCVSPVHRIGKVWPEEPSGPSEPAGPVSYRPERPATTLDPRRPSTLDDPRALGGRARAHQTTLDQTPCTSPKSLESFRKDAAHVGVCSRSPQGRPNNTGEPMKLLNPNKGCRRNNVKFLV